MVAFLVCFSEIEFVFLKKNLIFLSEPFTLVFCFRNNWRLTAWCWFSGRSENTKSLLDASSCVSRLRYFNLTDHLVFCNDTLSLYRK